MSNVGERRRQVRRVRMQWISGEPAQISIIIESDFHLAGMRTAVTNWSTEAAGFPSRGRSKTLPPVAFDLF